MFIDIVATSRSETEVVAERTGLYEDPPEGLVAAIAWESSEDEITTVMVWETPAARGEFAYRQMMPLIEEVGLTGEPEIVKPFRVFLRSTD